MDTAMQQLGRPIDTGESACSATFSARAAIGGTAAGFRSRKAQCMRIPHCATSQSRVSQRAPHGTWAWHPQHEARYRACCVNEVDEVIASRIGRVVGTGWQLKHVIGVGGMAAVYAACRSETEQAAVKILHPEMTRRKDVRERFVREACVANRIDHAGSVRVLEHGTSDDLSYLVMELLQGATLAQLIQLRGVPEMPELLRIVAEVLGTLAAAHRSGVVHRDLKPDNLFVTSQNHVKVLDFGIARMLDSVPGDFKTRTGMALGTLPYMAPEQALGRRDEIDGRADLFSLGATIFRILSGRRVHEAPSEAELLMAMASRPAPPLASVAPHVPVHVCRIVDFSLAFARDARYPDALTMLGDVDAVRHGQPPPWASAKTALASEPTAAEHRQPWSPKQSGRHGTAVMAPPPAAIYPSRRPQAFETAPTAVDMEVGGLPPARPALVNPHVEPTQPFVGAPVSTSTASAPRAGPTTFNGPPTVDEAPGVAGQGVVAVTTAAPAPLVASDRVRGGRIKPMLLIGAGVASVVVSAGALVLGFGRSNELQSATAPHSPPRASDSTATPSVAPRLSAVPTDAFGESTTPPHPTSEERRNDPSLQTVRQSGALASISGLVAPTPSSPPSSVSTGPNPAANSAPSAAAPVVLPAPKPTPAPASAKPGGPSGVQGSATQPSQAASTVPAPSQAAPVTAPGENHPAQNVRRRGRTSRGRGRNKP